MTFENKGAMASTCVVAAQDSLNIAAADYVCTAAVNDDVVIQEALNNYGEVVLLEGNYTPQANLTVPDDTCLRGQGFGTIITPTGAAIGGAQNGAIEMGDRSMLKSMKVILAAGAGGAGTRPNVVYANTKTQVWIEDVWVYGDESVVNDGSILRQNGICLTIVTDSKVINCRSEDNKRVGIIINVSSENTLTGNTCQGNTQYGIQTENSDNNVITGNTCQGNAVSGMYIHESNNTTITSNVCQGNTENGINVYGIGANDTVVGNICQGNSRSGIYVRGTTNSTITGNTCQGNTWMGMYIYLSDNNTITGNTCADNVLHGIYINTCNQNVVTGNQCDNNGTADTWHGIYIYRSSYCTVTGNVCVNNLIDGINVTGDGTTDSHYNTLTANVCYNNGDDGIEIAGGADAVKNIVLGNQLTGNAGTALVDGGVNTEIGHNITV